MTKVDRVRLEPMHWTWALPGRAAPPLQDRELQVLRQVVSGLTDRDIAAKLARYGLTNRELQVLREIVLGMTKRDTAAKLKISVEDVMQHLCSIYDKTGACGRVELLELFR